MLADTKGNGQKVTLGSSACPQWTGGSNVQLTTPNSKAK